MKYVSAEKCHIVPIHRNYKFARLDGSAKPKAEETLSAEFWTESENLRLRSVRAGGLAINVTAAKRAISYDSDWNPTIDSQAIGSALAPAKRIHRVPPFSLHRWKFGGDKVVQETEKGQEIFVFYIDSK